MHYVKVVRSQQFLISQSILKCQIMKTVHMLFLTKFSFMIFLAASERICILVRNIM